MNNNCPSRYHRTFKHFYILKIRSKTFNKDIIAFFLGFILFLIGAEVNAILPTSLKDQDKQFRARVVGKEQVDIENKLIAAHNGVFVLFTPTHGTPQMISEKEEFPEGLIPQVRMDSYEASVIPRVKTTHEMPANEVRCIYIRYKPHRPQADNETLNVDETYYNQFVAQYPHRILNKVISPEVYQHYINRGIPAAFYYYIKDEKPDFYAVFGKQINANIGNKLSDPGTYHNRNQDLKIVNEMLTGIGLASVEELINIDLTNQRSGVHL